MASIYRFSRKSKKEDPNAKKAKSSGKEKDDFFPLLFEDEGAEKKEEKALAGQAESAPEEDLSFTDTRVIPEVDGENKVEEAPVSNEDTQVIPESVTEEKTKDEASPSGADTLTFRLPPLEEVEKSAPEELLRALQETPVDNQKLDEVFNHSKGSLSGNTSQKEYDEATELLKEIFGSDRKKKKKKGKNQAETESSEEIRSVFDESRTLEEALQEAREQDAAEGDDGYVAVHDSQDESTKEYQASASPEEGTEALSAEEGKHSVPELSDEVRVVDQDDPYQDTYDELETVEEREKGLPEEFTTQEEYDEFAEHLRGKNYKSMCICLWTFLLFLALLYLESATFSGLYHPEALKPGGLYNSVIYLLVDIWMVLITAIVALPVVSSGFKGIFRGKPGRNSITALLVLFSLAHPALLLFTGVQEYPLFGALTALFIFIGAIGNFLESKRIYRTFRICGRRGDKLVSTELSGECPEAEAFREQLEGEPKFYSVHKASFIDGFFRRVEEHGRSARSYGTTMILAFLASAGFAAFSYWKEPDVALTANRFMIMAMMTFPLSGIFTVTLPFSHLSKKAEKTECAIVSAAEADAHSACDVVSFTDKEIFPPKNVKLTTIRTYGKTRIDKAILYAAMIFQKLGGPLSEVFKKTISGVFTEISEDFEFLEITADGMCAKIDGKDVFVGNKNYLLSYDFGYTKDSMDEDFESKSGKIMYMVIGSELAAKFYIRYSMSKRFRATILSLFKCGICPAVKTCDPNIDGDLFRTLLQNDKIPAGIIKTCDAMKDAPAAERSEAGLVCTSSIANLLHGFTLCDSLRHLCRSNAVISTLSLLIGAGIVLFLFFIENLTKVSGLFAILYQLLWLVPVVIPSLSE
ncbi:MAG: hypothetical protein IKJ74_06850 [Clostridia bacterium]|nr:hypothetical protein [Clostridia bacterium]